VAGGVSPGEEAEPRLSSDFSSATFRAPLTSAIAALPSLLAPRFVHSPISSGNLALEIYFEVCSARSSAGTLYGSQARGVSRWIARPPG
jgi:hypothetical protein